MDRRTDPILLIAEKTRRRQLADVLAGLGRRAEEAEDWARGTRRIRGPGPAVILADPSRIPDPAAIRTFKEAHPQVQVVVATHGEAMAAALETLAAAADDFLVLPAPAHALALVLRRGEEKARLMEELRTARENIETLARKRATERVETARLVTAKQIVDQFSTFIGRIADKAQGGMKFFDEMPYFVSIHDRSVRVIAANRTHQKHFGNQIGANSWEIYRGKFAGPATCPVSQTIATGSVQTLRAAVEYQSGTRVPVIVHTAPIFDNAGETVLVLEVAAGTREIKKMAEAVRSSQQRYQKLFDHAPSFIAVLDHRLRIAAVNRRFRENFGENIGRPFEEVLQHQCLPNFQCPIRQTLADAASHHAEMMLTAEDGRQFSMLIWTSPIFSATRKLTHVIVILADVSEQRRLQDHLATLGLMIGSISHGLKGTLTGLDAGLYLIETGFYRNRPARIEEGLDAAKLMTEHVRKMVSDILYYAKERELEVRRVDAARFASEVAAAVETRIRAADIEFSCRIDPGLGFVEIDPGLIRSALVNILENAMEACIADNRGRAGRIEFAVSAAEDGIVFDIRDNGTGISPEEMANMFTLFYSSKGNRGTGLGLYITDKVVQKHGGEVRVDSRPDRGSRFTIRLPRTPPKSSRGDNEPISR